METGLGVLEKVDTSVAVVVTEPSWATPLLRWGAYEAGRRHSPVRTLELTGPDEFAELIRGDRPVDPGGPIASMIVVGPLDRSTLAELVFRPQSSALACPVVVVPRLAWATPLPEGERPAITVGFSGSRSSGYALGWAVTEAMRRRAWVRAVLAWSEGSYGWLGGCVPIDIHLHGFPALAAQELAVASLAATGLDHDDVGVIARRGTPTRVLVHEAAGSDLLVVAAGESVVHNHRVLGPTALGCVTGSSVPVVIVRAD